MNEKLKGTCPDCGGEMEYGLSSLQDGRLYLQWCCNNCPNKGKEWHTLTFNWHTTKA